MTIANFLGFIIMTNFKTSCGFSDIITATFGILLFFTIEVLNKDLKLNLDYSKSKVAFFFMIYLASTTIVIIADALATLYGFSWLLGINWIIIAIVINAIAVWIISKKLNINKNQIKSYLWKNPRMMILLVMISILLFGLPIFSQLSVQQNTMANGAAHFIGLYAGFFIPYFLYANKLTKKTL